jgi:G3E family GTPase
MLTDLSTNKRDKFDHVLIETTGLANPAPIVQTFFLDEGLAANYRLDGIVTVVDCKHVMLRLDEVCAPPSSTPPPPAVARPVAPGMRRGGGVDVREYSSFTARWLAVSLRMTLALQPAAHVCMSRPSTAPGGTT